MRLSASSMEMLLECEQKFDWRYQRGYLASDTQPQVIGKHINQVLRRYWCLPVEERNEFALSVFHEEGLAAIRVQHQPAFVKEVAEKSVAMLQSYYRAYGQDSAIPQCQQITIEAPYTATITYCESGGGVFLPSVYTGKPDIESITLNEWRLDFNAALLLYKGEGKNVTGYVITTITRPDHGETPGVARQMMVSRGKAKDIIWEEAGVLSMRLVRGLTPIMHRGNHCNWCSYKQLCYLMLSRGLETAVEAAERIYLKEVIEPVLDEDEEDEGLPF